RRVRAAAGGAAATKAGRYWPCCSAVPHRESALLTAPGARQATAIPRSPCERASATSTFVTAVRSAARPPTSSGTPIWVTPSSAAVAVISSGGRHAGGGGVGGGDERAGRRGHRREAGAGEREHGALGAAPDAEPVEGGRPGEAVDGREAEAEGGEGGAPHGAVPLAVRPGARGSSPTRRRRRASSGLSHHDLLPRAPSRPVRRVT